MIPASAVAAAACVRGNGKANCAAKLTGPGGGVGVNPTIPPPTLAANAAKPVSMPGAASGDANAVASAVSSAPAAAFTVVDAGTIPLANVFIALAHAVAQAALVDGGEAASEVSSL